MQFPANQIGWKVVLERYIWHCCQPWENYPPPTFLHNLDHVELLYAQRACHFNFILYEKLRFSLDRSVLEALRLFIKLDYLAFASAHLSHTSCSIHKGSNLGTSLRKLAGSSVTTYRSWYPPDPRSKLNRITENTSLVCLRWRDTVRAHVLTV